MSSLATNSPPLLKVRLLLTGLYSTHIGFSPPRPNLRPEEKGNPSGITLWKTAAFVVKIILCGRTLAETAVILAQHLPSSPLSDTVLSYLTPNLASVSRLRITPLFLTGFALTFAGGLIRVWSHQALGEFFSWKLAGRDDHHLVTTGPYAYVRHPAYLGSTLQSVGNVLTFYDEGSWWKECAMGLLGDGILSQAVGYSYAAWWGLLVSYLWFRVDGEDGGLSMEFGSVWQKWAERVHYRLIPYVY